MEAPIRCHVETASNLDHDATILKLPQLREGIFETKEHVITIHVLSELMHNQYQSIHLVLTQWSSCPFRPDSPNKPFLPDL
jgi:hypothetical protein